MTVPSEKTTAYSNMLERTGGSCHNQDINSDQAEVYVDGVEKAIAEAEKLGGIVSLIVPMLGLPIGVSILDAYLILNMAKMAKSAGTGIIMHIQRDYVTQTDTYSFSPQ